MKSIQKKIFLRGEVKINTQEKNFVIYEIEAETDKLSSFLVMIVAANS